MPWIPATLATLDAESVEVEDVALAGEILALEAEKWLTEVSGDAEVDAVTVAAVTTVGAPVVSDGSTGDATVNATTVAAVTTIGAAAASAGVTLTPGIVAAVTTVGSPTKSAGVTLSPAVVAAVSTVGAASVTAAGDVTINATTVTATTTIPATAVDDGSTNTVNAVAVAALAAVPAADVTGVNNLPIGSSEGTGTYIPEAVLHGDVPPFDGADSFLLTTPQDSFVLTYLPMAFSEHVSVSYALNAASSGQVIDALRVGGSAVADPDADYKLTGQWEVVDTWQDGDVLLLISPRTGGYGGITDHPAGWHVEADGDPVLIAWAPASQTVIDAIDGFVWQTGVDGGIDMLLTLRGIDPSDPLESYQVADGGVRVAPYPRAAVATTPNTGLTVNVAFAASRRFDGDCGISLADGAQLSDYYLEPETNQAGFTTTMWDGAQGSGTQMWPQVVPTFTDDGADKHINVSVALTGLSGGGTRRVWHKLRRGEQWGLNGRTLLLKDEMERIFPGSGPWQLEAQYAYNGSSSGGSGYDGTGGGTGGGGTDGEGDADPDPNTPPPPTVPPPAGAILYGSSPNGASGGSKQSIVEYVNTIFGGLNVLRAFDDFPTTWSDTRTARFAPTGCAVIVSIKPGLANVANGTVKERIKAFLRTIPASIPWVGVCMHHEPENDEKQIPSGETTTGRIFRAAWVNFLKWVDEVRAEGKCQNVNTVTILMSFSVKHRNPEEWYVPGADILGWDTYNRENLTALRNYSIAKGKPWLVAEIGAKPVNNYSDAAYANELEAFYNIWTTGATLPVAVCYFQSTVGDNYVITPETRPISVAWWKHLVQTGSPP